jgi:hypothetical protein
MAKNEITKLEMAQKVLKGVNIDASSMKESDAPVKAVLELMEEKGNRLNNQDVLDAVAKATAKKVAKEKPAETKKPDSK